MAQTVALIDTLNLCLKSHGKTYAAVARYLTLSEASVKRLFADRSFSLQCFDEICQIVLQTLISCYSILSWITYRDIMKSSLQQLQSKRQNIELP